jgi:ribosome biogenesis protein MAK21
LEQRKLYKDIPDNVLFAFFIEDAFCRAYADVVQVIRHQIYNDPVLQTKHRAIAMITQCLIRRPEQEKTLLTILVDKLGDPSKQTASKAISQIFHLLDTHPSMALVVVSYVWQFISTHPPVHSDLRSYALNVLTNIPFLPPFRHHSQQRVSLFSCLLDHYLKFLHWVSNIESSASTEKVTAMILKGIGRVFPVVISHSDTGSEALKSLQGQLDALYEMTGATHQWSKSLQALCLLHSISLQSETAPSIRERFLETIKKAIHDPRLVSASMDHQFQFLTLVKNVIASLKDNQLPLIWRLLTTAIFCHEPQVICYALGILSETMNRSNSLRLQATESIRAQGIYRHLLTHYHPSVKRMTEKIRDSADESGNMLNLESFEEFSSLSTNHFLERFSMKNPKGSKASEEQPLVSSKAFLALGSAKVPEHERFFYEYFKGHTERVQKTAQKQKKRKLRKGKKDNGAEDEVWSSDGGESLGSDFEYAE